MALKGLKVIEIAGLAPAPFCGMVLSDFGARVIRVDRLKAQNLDRLSRGKESIAVNLKIESGVNIVKKLCQTADVLIEPFRPGVMEKLGLSPEVLLHDNPRLVYARLTGYGQTGPMAHKAGHDINYIAMSGILSRFGRHGERPYPPVNVVADFAGGGLTCAMGIMMALLERTSSGRGQVVDCSMSEGSAYLASFIDGTSDWAFPKERGQNMLDGGLAFYDTYKTQDGKFMAVGSLEPQFYKDLLQGLGLDSKEVTQLDDQDQQRVLFAQTFASKTQAEWVGVFDQLDACVTPVLTPLEAANHPHNVARGAFVHGILPQPQGAPAPKLSRTETPSAARPLPSMGAHTTDVLLEHGYTHDELKELAKLEAIKPGKSKL